MKISRIISIFTLALSLVILTACNKECEDCPGQAPSSDVTKPIITVQTPVNEFTLTAGDTLYFRARFTDDRELGQYKIDIHNADDGHSHGKKNGAAPFFEYQTIITLSGVQSEQVVAIPVPAASAAGKHHLIVTAVDKAGNEANFQEVDFYLINPEDTMPPTVTLTHPDVAAPEIEADFAVGQDTLQAVILGTLTDTKDGTSPGELYGYEIVFEKAGAHQHKTAEEGHSEPIYKISNFNLAGSIHTMNVTLILRKTDLENHGEYHLKVVAIDHKNNRSEREIKYHVHMD